jgi:hypothetical protein
MFLFNGIRRSTGSASSPTAMQKKITSSGQGDFLANFEIIKALQNHNGNKKIGLNNFVVLFFTIKIYLF